MREEGADTFRFYLGFAFTKFTFSGHGCVRRFEYRQDVVEIEDIGDSWSMSTIPFRIIYGC